MGLVAFLALPARAEDDRRVGVVVQGNEAVEKQLASQLRDEGYAAVSRPLPPKALDTLLNCFVLEDLACARGVVEARARTSRLLFARVESSDGAFDLTWFSTGHEPIQKRGQGDWRPVLGSLVAGDDVPIVTDTGPARARKRSKLWPRVLLTAGALALVGGGVSLYYGLRDGASHKYIYPSLTPVGISLIAVGGGAAIGGLFWAGEL